MDGIDLKNGSNAHTNSLSDPDHHNSDNDGDIEQEFLQAYDDWSDAIYRHCLFRVYKAELAEELVQETFLKTWKYLSGGKKVDNLKAFLYKVANNLIIDHSRKHKEDSLEQVLANAPQLEPSYEGTQQLHLQAAYQETVSVMHSLPEDAKNLLIMRFIDDMEPREIAAVLGLSANNVSVKINRALALLRSKLK